MYNSLQWCSGYVNASSAKSAVVRRRQLKAPHGSSYTRLYLCVIVQTYRASDLTKKSWYTWSTPWDRWPHCYRAAARIVLRRPWTNGVECVLSESSDTDGNIIGGRTPRTYPGCSRSRCMPRIAYAGRTVFSYCWRGGEWGGGVRVEGRIRIDINTVWSITIVAGWKEHARQRRNRLDGRLRRTRRVFGRSVNRELVGWRRVVVVAPHCYRKHKTKTSRQCENASLLLPGERSHWPIRTCLRRIPDPLPPSPPQVDGQYTCSSAASRAPGTRTHTRTHGARRVVGTVDRFRRVRKTERDT